MNRTEECCEAVLKYRMQHFSGEHLLQSERALNT